MQEVNLNSKKLLVLASNLEEYVIYYIKIESKFAYSNSVRVDTVSEKLNITVRDIQDYRKVEDLGVKANLIKIDPKTGISGDTKFTASYSICNSPAYLKPSISTNVWKYMIQYGEKDDLVTLTSD